MTHRISLRRAFPVTFMSLRAMGRARSQTSVAARAHAEPGHLGFLVGGFFHSGLESVICCLCAHAKQAFTSAYVEESGVNLLERQSRGGLKASKWKRTGPRFRARTLLCHEFPSHPEPSASPSREA